MGIINWALNQFGYIKMNQEATPAGTIEKQFGVGPAASRKMRNSQALWWAMYTNHPPWETDCVRPLGLPGAIGRELSRHVLAEFSLSVSGGARAEYLDRQLQAALPQFPNHLELGLCLGGLALKPCPEGDRIGIKAFTTGFTPTRFDSGGRAVGGVFKTGPVRQGKDWFVRLEYHDLLPQNPPLYIIENQAFRSDSTGGVGAQVPLDMVEEWAGLEERLEVENLSGPLFAFFRPPVSNQEEPGSPLGVSVYGGAVAERIQEADQQWERIWWEYKSGERKIFADGKLSPGQLSDRLFLHGAFTRSGDLFQEFSPDFRQSALYDGFQYILKIIEFNVGLAFGTLSDPQAVNRTATEEIMTKHRQYVTEGAIQKTFETALDNLLYAMDALCTLYGLAPDGSYEASYAWGDGILDDPETKRQDMAMGLQLLAAGVIGPVEFRMTYFGEDEETARQMLPGVEEMVE